MDILANIIVGAFVLCIGMTIVLFIGLFLRQIVFNTEFAISVIKSIGAVFAFLTFSFFIGEAILTRIN